MGCGHYLSHVLHCNLFKTTTTTTNFQLNKSYLFIFFTFFFLFLYYREQHRMHYMKCTTLFSSEKGNLNKRSRMDQPKAIEFNREAFSGISKPWTNGTVPFIIWDTYSQIHFKGLCLVKTVLINKDSRDAEYLFLRGDWNTSVFQQVQLLSQLVLLFFAVAWKCRFIFGLGVKVNEKTIDFHHLEI